jgi:ribonuclease P protein subunit POP4
MPEKQKTFLATGENLGAQELIGLRARVVDSTDKSRIGAVGRIIDETKNTFVLEAKGREKTLPKVEVTLKIFFSSKKSAVVCGKELVGRPEERIRAWFRRKMD